MNTPAHPGNERPCACVKDEVSRIQQRSYKAFGRDPLNIRADSINLAKGHIAQKMDPRLRDDLMAGVEAFEQLNTTDYQDALVLYPIVSYWHHVVSVYGEVFPGRVDEGNPILLATIPDKALNSIAMRDRKGDYAIIFYEGLRYLPMIFGETAVAIFEGTLEKTDTAIKWNIAAAVEWENVQRQIHPVKTLLTALFTHLTTPYMTGLDSLKALEQEYTGEAILLFREGFNFFICSHEYSHCANDHAAGRLTMARPKDDRDALDALLKDAALSSQPITEENHENYSRKQYTETVADCEAFLTLFEYTKRLDPFDRQFFTMGALSFFWYLELHERITRTLHLGPDWENDEKYRLPFRLQNFLHRKTHPTPLSRFHEARATCTHPQLHFPPTYDPFWALSEECWGLISKLYENVWRMGKLAVNHQANQAGVDRSWRMPDVKGNAATGVDDLSVCIY